MFSPDPLLHSNLTSLPLIGRGKVRDIYAVGEDKLLLLQSDRVSAFDVIMNDPIPNKGFILTEMSKYWFNITSPLVENHLTDIKPEDVVTRKEQSQVQGRSLVVQKYNPIPIEAVVRGYLAGSGWEDYRSSGSVCGIKLPENLRHAEQLTHPIFTPATKANPAEHDQNISFNSMCKFIGKEVAIKIKNKSLEIYEHATSIAASKGLIIADTKFEFSQKDDGKLVLIDEVLTPDSSRYWRVSDYQSNALHMSLDKQFIRDWLKKQSWNKKPPPPKLPVDIVMGAQQKYQELSNLFKIF